MKMTTGRMVFAATTSTTLLACCAVAWASVTPIPPSEYDPYNDRAVARSTASRSRVTTPMTR